MKQIVLFSTVLLASALAYSQGGPGEVPGGGQPGFVPGGFGGGGGGGGGGGRGVAPIGMGEGMPGIPGGPMGRPSGCLVVLSGGRTPVEIAEIQEDLSIMGRILEKSLEQQARSVPARKLGVVIQSLGRQQPQSAYIEGYGALFQLHTQIPLVASAAAPGAANSKLPPKQVWQQTRDELYGGGGGAGLGQPRPDYDEDVVKAVKQEIVAAIGNASNMRHLKPESYITVTLIGAPTESPQGGTSTGGGGGGGGGGSGGMAAGGSFSGGFAGSFASAGPGGWGGFSVSSGGSELASMLTIRVKKADVDAFAQGKLSQADFEKRAVVQAYAAGAPDNMVTEFSGREW